MEYKIGQLLKFAEDCEVTMALSGKTVTMPKGTEVVIGADNLIHYNLMRAGKPIALVVG